jgi:predicted nucleotidyltransferase
MDYRRPIEAVVPGVQGRVLRVLAHAAVPLTMRTVADLAGASVDRTNVVLHRLIALGLVERREAGRAAQVTLVRDNAAAQAIVALAELWTAIVDRMRADAATIDPAPASLVIFGSFARGDADEDSDIDVLAVRARGVALDDHSWTDTLRHWADRSTRLAGNTVNLLDESIEDLPRPVGRRGSVWDQAMRDGILLAGTPLVDLARAAR